MTWRFKHTWHKDKFEGEKKEKKASKISQGLQEFEYSVCVAVAEQGSSYKIHTSGYKQWYCTVMKQLKSHQIDWDDG